MDLCKPDPGSARSARWVTAIGLCVALSMSLAAVGCTAPSTQQRPRQSGSDSAPGAETTSAPAGQAGGAQSEAPTIPAAPGVPLEPVYQPPQRTVAMIEPSTTDTRATYLVRFQPFGPAASGALQMVVRITKSVPKKVTKKPFDFNGRNALVLVSPAIRDALKTGGTYTAELRFLLRGGLLVPTLERVRKAKS